jgi:hypothetical protein
VAVALCLAAAGCTTNAEIAAQRDAEFQSLVGGTMADFMRRTGLTPTDMYPTSSGRTFVVNGPASTIVVPGSYGVPTIAAQRQCRMLIDTETTDGKGTADSWRVARITRNGCG